MATCEDATQQREQGHRPADLHPPQAVSSREPERAQPDVTAETYDKLVTVGVGCAVAVQSYPACAAVGRVQ